MKTMQTTMAASVVAQKAILDGITRSQSQYVSKADLDAFAAANNVTLAAIQKDVSAMGAMITAMGTITVNSGGTDQSGIGSTSTTPDSATNPPPTVNCNGTQIPCPNTDLFGYQKNIQNLQLTEPFTNPPPAPSSSSVPAPTSPPPTVVPIGQVSFDASKQNPWSVDTYPRSYAVSNVLATDQDGKETVYNQFQITTNGQTYKVPITTANFVQQYPSPSFSFWNPRLYLGLDGGILLKASPTGVVAPSINFGFMTYGQTKTSPDFSILQLGVGYNSANQDVQFQVSPFQYRLPIPFLQSTYLGPTVAIDAAGQYSATLGVRIGM